MVLTPFRIFGLASTLVILGAAAYLLWMVWQDRRRKMKSLREFADTLPEKERGVFWGVYKQSGMFWHMSDYPNAVSKHRAGKTL
jgi:threonine/homoserine/homoserine lactone efflux protein